ncbi:MAG: 4Fe-4S dicluster domain-containing protein [Pseudomonadota bacterium]
MDRGAAVARSKGVFMGNRVLVIQEENCTGCRLCELACSSFKEGSFIPERSRVKVIYNALEGWSRPSVCLQCEDPMCMAVCPAEAISRAATPQGDPFVQVDKERCIGCRRCSVACPFGAIVFFPKSMAVKCDLCQGSPKCVEFCFYNCLHFLELPDEEFEKRNKNVKFLITKACKEISSREPLERRAMFSLKASKVSGRDHAEPV